MNVWLAAYEADEPEGSQANPTHLQRKDLRNILLVIAVLIALSIPVYNQMKAQAHQHTCRTNLKEIGQAMALYREENNDRFPPTHVREAGGDAPMLFAGKPSTWATQVQPYMVVRASFVCPAASESEGVMTEHLMDKDKSFLSHYGMFEPRGGVPLNALTNPDTAVVLGETSNHGTNETYNPLPMKSTSGDEVSVDGFLIGFDVDDKDGIGAKYVTRMALPDTKSGEFKEDGRTRHPSGTQVLFASGSTAFLPPTAARVERLGRNSEEIVRFWKVDR